MKMNKLTALFILPVLAFALSACTAPDDKGTNFGDPGQWDDIGTGKTVGTDIQIEDITDFYYTVENINYDAFYQRYRFYVEDGKYLFYHETRQRKDDYGPCTENDTTSVGTVELTEDQWSGFYELVKGGSVTARKESADSGGTGPWLYLYWKNDQSKYQQFAFSSYATEQKFEEFCEALVPVK